MRPAEEVVSELRDWGVRRACAIQERAIADEKIAKLFGEVQARPDMEIKRTAAEAGIGRSLAYKLMRKGD